MDKEKELLSLKEENRKLKENLNQKLRLELFGLKPSKKKEEKSSDEVLRQESKRLGPPVEQNLGLP